VKSALTGYDLVLDQKNLRISKTELTGKKHSVVLTGRNPGRKEMAVMFIATGLPEALPGLGRKLPITINTATLPFRVVSR